MNRSLMEEIFEDLDSWCGRIFGPSKPVCRVKSTVLRVTLAKEHLAAIENGKQMEFLAGNMRLVIRKENA